MAHICAEIMYDHPDGSVHSDVCAIDETQLHSQEYREFLHANLDEWLDKSNGSGIFYIGDIYPLAEEINKERDIADSYTLADMYGSSPYFDPANTWEGMDSRYPAPEL
jgi:hypothetical protein